MVEWGELMGTSRRLKKFFVQGLFGLFDHTVDFRLDDRITIIHAPNGYGKTVVLKMISGFFGGSLAIFRQVEFRNIHYTFDDDTEISITKREDAVGSAGELKQQPMAPFSIKYRKEKKILHEWDRWDLKKITTEPRRRLILMTLERHLPFMTRIGPGEFRDDRSGEILSDLDAIEQNLEYLPAEVRAEVAPPKWLDEIRKSIHCQLIETQRLILQKDPRGWTRDRPALIPAVNIYSSDLISAIAKTLAESATVSSALDRTFPNRVLARLGESTSPLSEATLRTRLAELEQNRKRLTNVDLLEKSDEGAIVSQAEFDEPTRKFLTEYVSDAEKKLDTYQYLLPRLELLIDIINSRFQFKSLSISRKYGFVVLNIAGKAVAIDALSSGEQHELVLVYGLLFKTHEGTLLLIDEPEISLHIGWQKKFLSDLGRIIALSPMDVVLSTHSPQLIGGSLDLTVQLEGPVSAKSARK